MKTIKLITLAVISVTLSGCMFLVGGYGMGPGKLFATNTPKAYKDLTNPIKADAGNMKVGKNLYNNNCLRCHGITGKGDGPDADTILPTPANLQKTMNRFIAVRDDYLFYSISEGKNNQNGMPAFKASLSKEQRWKIVNYIRTFKGE